MYGRNKEVDEAIEAGRRALDALTDAADSLDSAKRWGVVDILGGGFLTSVVKHSRLGDANRALGEARQELAVFARELGDVRDFSGVSAYVDKWNAFFDICCDNFLADIMVQKQIDDASDRVDEAIRAVRNVLKELERQR